MNFEVVNDKNKTVMRTSSPSCVPDKDMLNLISKAGYKFKIDGKVISCKNIVEKMKEITNGNN